MAERRARHPSREAVSPPLASQAMTTVSFTGYSRQLFCRQYVKRLSRAGATIHAPEWARKSRSLRAFPRDLRLLPGGNSDGMLATLAKTLGHLVRSRHPAPTFNPYMGCARIQRTDAEVIMEPLFPPPTYAMLIAPHNVPLVRLNVRASGVARPCE